MVEMVETTLLTALMDSMTTWTWTIAKTIDVTPRMVEDFTAITSWETATIKTIIIGVETHEVVILGVVIDGLEEVEMATIDTDDAKPSELLHHLPFTATSFRTFCLGTSISKKNLSNRKA